MKSLRQFAADKVAGKKLMERGFTTHWDNWKASKARDPQKKTDGLGKNSENHGASCLGGPSVPGMLADVVGRAVPRPESCESGSKVPVARQLLPQLDDHVDQRLDDNPATQEKTNRDDNGSRQGESGHSSESGGAATAAARSAGEARPRGTGASP